MDPLQYFYSTYLKTLRYNTYVLRSRVNDFLKNKKEIQLKLPKFFKQDQVATGKEFFEFFTSFNPTNITMQDFRG